MLVLLPPSESKAVGGLGSAVDLLALRYPELRAHRDALMTELMALSAQPEAARFALRVRAAKDDEVRANTLLRASPTMPVLDRYTGVLYDALDAPGMTPAERTRANARVVVMSSLFGPVSGGDLIPGYRLSAGCSLPHVGTVAGYWKPVIAPLLAALDEPVIDLRSGAYGAFGAVPGAITVRAVSVRPDGSRAVVSHFNKHVKGLLARVVATTRAELDDVDDVIDAASKAGLRAEQSGPLSIELVS